MPRIKKRNVLIQKTPDEAGLDEIRAIAQEMAYHFTFHEIAIADAFKAETEVREYGRRLMEIVGWPKGWVSYE